MKKTAIIISIFIFSATILFSQFNNKSKTELEDSKKKIEKEIEYNNKLLRDISKNKNSSLTQLKLITKKLEAQMKLINQIDNQLNSLDKQIRSKSTSITRNQKELDALKNKLAKMIRFAYKNRMQVNQMNYIFGADNFRQAFLRLRYFQELNMAINERVEKIKKLQLQLQSDVESLEKVKGEKLSLKNEREIEKNNLGKEQKEKDKIVKECSKKEKEIRKANAIKEDNMKKIKTAIDKIIADEIRKAQEAEKKKTKASTNTKKTQTTPSTPKTIPLTPEQQALSAIFTENKGKLPWPVEKGIITGSFGLQQHKELPNIKTDNKGIDILTSENSDARAVYKGTVKSISSIPQFGHIVIVQHGEYFTVYAKLTEVYVKQGEQVDTKQKIGRILTDPSDKKTEIHFQIWRGKNIENPSLWIAK